MTEDEMVGWPHRLDGHEFEQSLGESAGQGSWHAAAPGVAESDTAEGLNSGGCSHPCWLHISSTWAKLSQSGALMVRATPLQPLVQILQTQGSGKGPECGSAEDRLGSRPAAPWLYDEDAGCEPPSPQPSLPAFSALPTFPLRVLTGCGC